MHKKFLFFLFLGFFSPLYVAFAQNEIAKWRKEKIANQFTISVPDSFMPMTDDEYAKKYGAYKSAVLMLSSQDKSADFGINRVETTPPKNFTKFDEKATWSRNDLEMMRNLYKSSILKMHQKVTFIQDEIQTINGRDFVVFEFVAEVTETETNYATGSAGVLKQYSYLQYCVSESSIWVFNFTTQAKYRALWEKAAREIMVSVAFK